MAKKIISFFFISILLGHFSAFGKSFSFSDFKTVPIQHGGRIKPLDTFSREVVQTVTGKTTFMELSSIDIIFSWMILPKMWAERDFIEISSPALKEYLKLKKDKKYFSPIEILRLQNLIILLDQVHQKKNHDEKLSVLDSAAERLEMQLTVMEKVSSGALVTLIPNPFQWDQSWFSVEKLLSLEGLFASVADVHSEVVSKAEDMRMTVLGLFESYRASDEKTFALTSKRLKQVLKEFSAPGYPFVSSLSQEVFYNEFRPFRVAWI